MDKNLNYDNFIKLYNLISKKSERLHECQKRLEELNSSLEKDVELKRHIEKTIEKTEKELKELTSLEDSLMMQIEPFENSVFLMNLFNKKQKEFSEVVLHIITPYLQENFKARNVFVRFLIKFNTVTVYFLTPKHKMYSFDICYDICKLKQNINKSSSVSIISILNSNFTFSKIEFIENVNSFDELDVEFLSQSTKIFIGKL